MLPVQALVRYQTHLPEDMQLIMHILPLYLSAPKSSKLFRCTTCEPKGELRLDLIAWVKGLVIFHKLACMPRGIQHHAPLYFCAIRAHNMGAAVLVIHPVHLGHLKAHPCSNSKRF